MSAGCLRQSTFVGTDLSTIATTNVYSIYVLYCSGNSERRGLQNNRVAARQVGMTLHVKVRIACFSSSDQLIYGVIFRHR